MQPFETTLKKYLDTFLGQEMYFVNDTKNLEFFKENPTNTSDGDIRMKLSAVNDNELHQNGIDEDMVTHILDLSIDPRLQKGDLTLVEDIARLKAKGQTLNLLHFASVYCNFHRPDTYPIYSEQHFDFYRKYIVERKLPLNPDDLNSYSVFSKALNHLTEQLGLKGKMNYLQLRKFGWLYAERVLKESAGPGE